MLHFKSIWYTFSISKKERVTEANVLLIHLIQNKLTKQVLQRFSDYKVDNRFMNLTTINLTNPHHINWNYL